MNVESFQEKKYKATLAQQYDFSCGSAALATLLTYNYNIPVSEQEVFKDMFENGDKKVIAESGFSLLDIKNYLTRRGLESNGYRAPLEKLASVRLPAIVLINVRGYSHFVVLEGIQDGYVLLSDPANGMRSEPFGEFENQWTGIFFLILTNAEQAQEGIQQTRQKWAAAPGSALGVDALHGRPCHPRTPRHARASAGSEECSSMKHRRTASPRCSRLAPPSRRASLAGCSDSRITASAAVTALLPPADGAIGGARQRRPPIARELRERRAGRPRGSATFAAD